MLILFELEIKPKIDPGALKNPNKPTNKQQQQKPKPFELCPS